MEDWVRSKLLYKETTLARSKMDADKLCKYGVKCLDDALRCIMPNDLVVIGAETGAGKSEIGIHIAQTNAMAGKRVGVFYLEGGRKEAMQRLQWKLITQRYYDPEYDKKNYCDRIVRPITYLDWACNTLDRMESDFVVSIEGEVYADVIFKVDPNMFFYKTDKGFSREDLIKALHSFQEDKTMFLDLIIIDHLQYFELYGNNEIMETTEILRECKRITDFYGVPVVLISHLRKRNKDTGMATHEDFYGSGNIAKISSTAIILTPSKEEDYRQGIFPTYIRVVKSRVCL